MMQSTSFPQDLSLLTTQGGDPGDTRDPGLEQGTEGSMGSLGWFLAVPWAPQARTGMAAEFSPWISVVGGEGRHKSSKGHQMLVPLQERI